MKELLQKAAAGERLSPAEALELWEGAGFFDLLQAGKAVRDRKHPEPEVTFVIDRNVNYTNICQSGCRFCAFYRPPGSPEGFLLEREVILEKIGELVAAGGTQLLMQGGLHPDLGLEYFEELFSVIKGHYPGVQIHSLSPPEILYLSQRDGLPMPKILQRLRAAGLDSLPGGGAEILVDRVRRAVSPKKFSSDEWLGVMAEAHAQGLRTTATMVFGLGETAAERIEHLDRLRELQDRTGGFTAFIAWSFQPGKTALERHVEPEGGLGYIRLLALSRIYLDNFENVQASWVTQGAKLASLALHAGANDVGGTMMEENVVRAAGVDYRLSIREVIDFIRGAGYLPVQRDTLYRIQRRYA